MDFNMSDRQKDWLNRVQSFMTKHVRPAVPIYKQQDAEQVVEPGSGEREPQLGQPGDRGQQSLVGGEGGQPTACVGIRKLGQVGRPRVRFDETEQPDGDDLGRLRRIRQVGTDMGRAAVAGLLAPCGQLVAGREQPGVEIGPVVRGASTAREIAGPALERRRARRPRREPEHHPQLAVRRRRRHVVERCRPDAGLETIQCGRHGAQQVDDGEALGGGLRSGEPDLDRSPGGQVAQRRQALLTELGHGHGKRAGGLLRRHDRPVPRRLFVADGQPTELGVFAQVLADRLSAPASSRRIAETGTTAMVRASAGAETSATMAS